MENHGITYTKNFIKQNRSIMFKHLLDNTIGSMIATNTIEHTIYCSQSK
jgi:hypothetical protein